MPEMVVQNSLDRLHWLVSGKPTAGEFEDCGGTFNPQFRFLALLPSPALPLSEAAKIQSYFAAMFEALVPVRDSIAAYWLRGVMSRTPISDFSLEVQFLDPNIVELVRKTMPKELSGSVVTNQHRYKNSLTTQAEASMFFRRQENRDQTNGDLLQAQDAEPPTDSSSRELALHVVEIEPAAAAVLSEPVPTAPMAAPMQSLEQKRKKMLVADGVIIQGGDILGCEHLAIAGEAYSTIDRCQKLEILESGLFMGSASVVEAEISGYCKGTLVVKDTLRITRTGHVVGSIQYGRLQVEDGGRIEGEMKMPLDGNETVPQTQSENPHWVDLNAKLSA
jgi:cytoskeletal protein CcmA (bactofilin family)